GSGRPDRPWGRGRRGDGRPRRVGGAGARAARPHSPRRHGVAVHRGDDVRADPPLVERAGEAGDVGLHAAGAGPRVRTEEGDPHGSGPCPPAPGRTPARPLRPAAARAPTPARPPPPPRPARPPPT